MTLILFGLTLISFVGMAINVFLYLRSSQTLLELVQADEALWQRLGRPELVRGREGSTISPIFPWLSWVWAGEPAGLTPKIRTQLMTTSRQLKTGLLLFMATTTIFLALFFFAA